MASAPDTHSLVRKLESITDLTPEERKAVLAPLEDDVRLLNRITGIDVDDWLTQSGRGAYSVRRS